MIKDIGVYSVNNDEKIRLNGNENPVDCSEEEIRNIISKLLKVELNRYPNTDGDKVREAYADILGLTKENLIIGNGSDEMINLVISKNISKGDKVLTLAPDFVMYDFYTDLNDGKLIKYDIDLENGVDINKFINKGLEENAKLVIFSNPNNPTGYGFKIDEIKKVLNAFRDKVVLVDEAYFEFYGETMVPFINEYDNLIVTRTLSKAWGLAAIRVGFLISKVGNIKKLEKYKTPYNVNSISQEIAIEVLKNEKRFKENLDMIIEERENLYNSLLDIQEKANEKDIDIKFYKSKANFIYGRSKEKEKIINALNNNDIIIRNFNDDGFRITVGLSSENKKVLDLIDKALFGGEICE